ncbi:MAG: DUF4127 family protein [Armatimonadota bacterium]
MLPVVLLPLDDRPVNLADVCRLAAVAGERLVTPPAPLLGRFLHPGDPDGLLDWLAETLPHARLAILSLDMLAYGGLVASRTPVVTAEHALRRLARLREITTRCPQLRLLAFNVIMRLTITGSDPETRAAGRDIFRYSILRDEVERLGHSEQAAELAAVTSRIPSGLLDAYLQARARNHAVNRAAVSLLADGMLDFLALVQEDTAPAGLHVAEQQALVELAHRTAPPERWRLYAGTDEAGQTLLARGLLQEAGHPFPVTVRLRDTDAAEHPALYEDVPLCETVRRHVDAVGGMSTAEGLTLGVHTFTVPQQDLFDVAALPAPTWQAALETYPRTDADRWLPTLDIPLAIADVAYCNGGDPHLLDTLLADGRYTALSGYAGWNTAGNTLGTTLAHAALRELAQKRGVTPAMEQAQHDALLVRLLDDGLYQPIVRGWVSARIEESGISPLNLAEQAPRVERKVDEIMQALWHELHGRYPALAVLDRKFQVRLPWGRLFEMCVRYE